MTNLSRRLDQLERVAEEARRRPIRERVQRLIREHGVRLSPDGVERVVTGHLQREPRWRRMRLAGYSDEQIADVFIGELRAGRPSP